MCTLLVHLTMTLDQTSDALLVVNKVNMTDIFLFALWNLHEIVILN